MQPCDAIVCGDIGIDYTMVTGSALKTNTVSTITSELRGLGGGAGCRARFLAENGVRVHLIGPAATLDGNGRLLRREIDAQSAIEIVGLPGASETPYRVLLVTPDSAYRLNYAPPISIDSGSLGLALHDSLQQSPQAIVACQRSWWPHVARLLGEVDRPVLVWHENSNLSGLEQFDEPNFPVLHLHQADAPPPGWEWKFSVRAGSAEPKSTAEWLLPEGLVLTVPDIAWTDLAFFVGMILAMKRQCHLEEAVEYAGVQALRQAQGQLSRG